MFNQPNVYYRIRKKKIKVQQTQEPAFVPRPPQVRPVPPPATNRTLTEVPKSSQSNVIAPPKQQEPAVVDLTDDESPKKPPATPSVGWKPLKPVVAPPVKTNNPPAKTSNPPAKTSNPPVKTSNPPAKTSNPPDKTSNTQITGPSFTAFSSSWTPLEKAVLPIHSEKNERSTNLQNVHPSRREKWLQFKESFDNKPLNKIGETKMSDDPDSVTGNPEEDKKEKEDKGTTEIKWELNVLDDKKGTPESTKKDEKASSTSSTQIKPSTQSKPSVENKPPAQSKPSTQSKSSTQPKYSAGTKSSSQSQPSTESKPSAPQVVHGVASEIKLFTIKDKQKTSVQKTEPKPEEASNNPSTSTTTSNMRRHQPKPYKPMMHPLMSTLFGPNYPKGVPKSFLSQQSSIGAIQPQDQYPPLTPHLWAPNQSTIYELYNDAELNPNVPDPVVQQQYSPSDVQEHEGSESPDLLSGQKRLSAFQRLGPVSQPKKPKLTINLLFNQEQSVREVLGIDEEDEEKYTPVHLRKDVLDSVDETVLKYLPSWPWKRSFGVGRSVTARNSKSVMILEQEQMEEIYEKDNVFIQVSVKGYPRTWKKENVLDVILDTVKGKSFIPCFIDCTPDECKFLVIRCRSALVTFHKVGFCIRKEDVELNITVAQTELTVKQLEFLPRLVLRKQVAAGYDGERKLSLREFTTRSDISHFIYFPLNRVSNQSELLSLNSTVAWNYLTDLDLSHNRITSIDGFELSKTTPKLKHLDLSFNCLERVTVLLRNRELSLLSLKLEGNPLCHDYTDPDRYVKVVKMIFPSLNEIDGIPIHLKGDLPKPQRNFCPSDAVEVASKFLEVFFPLLEATIDDRARIQELYDDNAVLTVTYRSNLRYSPLHRKFRTIFLRARVFSEGEIDSIDGPANIARLIYKWPPMQHDPHTFTVDVMHHTENTTILRVGGILKLTSETLAEDEHLVAFTRTLVLTTIDGAEYKILNEMLYWDEPCKELAHEAFRLNAVRTSKRLSLKLDCNPDAMLKESLVKIFMQITGLEKPLSERCMEIKEWNLKTALEYFMKLVKLGDLNSLKL